LIVKVGFVKSPILNSRLIENVETVAELWSVTDATDDKKRMGVWKREKCPGGLNGGMAGLNHLLRMGEIAPDENVDV
jgi:hypothetical protein